MPASQDGQRATSAGWHGDINGRIPLLHHQRPLIMTSTIFGKNPYHDGISPTCSAATSKRPAAARQTTSAA